MWLLEKELGVCQTLRWQHAQNAQDSQVRRGIEDPSRQRGQQIAVHRAGGCEAAQWGRAQCPNDSCRLVAPRNVVSASALIAFPSKYLPSITQIVSTEGKQGEKRGGVRQKSILKDSQRAVGEVPAVVKHRPPHTLRRTAAVSKPTPAHS